MVSSPPDFYEVRAEQRSFTNVGAYHDRAVVLTGTRPARAAPGRRRLRGVFPVLGVSPPWAGGSIGATRSWGAHRRVILTDGFWRSRFGRRFEACSGARSASTGSRT